MNDRTPPKHSERISRDLFLIRVPTPFPVGRTNVVLIKRDPVTLVDTGPNSDRSWEVLTAELAQAGVSVADIERLVITHLHLDHMGLAERIVQQSGAQVLAHPGVARGLTNFFRQWKIEDEHYAAIYPSLGMPGELAQTMLDMSQPMKSLGCRIQSATPLQDGDELEFEGQIWRAIHTPGHTPHCLSLHQQPAGCLICGDFLLPHITPNPLLYRPAEPWALGMDALVQMLDSLNRIEKLQVQMVLPGHGRTFDDLKKTVASHIRQRRVRHRRVLKTLSQGPMPAYELALRIFPSSPLAEIFLMLSEVLGHIGLGMMNNEIDVYNEGGKNYYTLSRHVPFS